MNYTLLTADRMTHLRVVCVALSAAILVVSVCSFVRLSGFGDVREPAVKASGYFATTIERARL